MPPDLGPDHQGACKLLKHERVQDMRGGVKLGNPGAECRVDKKRLLVVLQLVEKARGATVAAVPGR